MRVAVLTQIPSPYQTELFDAVDARGVVSIAALYLYPVSAYRGWSMPALGHRGRVLDTREAEREGERWVDTADLVVFGDYADRRSAAWMARRQASGRPWCFWGERPGVHVKGWPGWALRRVRLSRLHGAAGAAIWGIGSWAVEGYRAEFGGARRYFNVPYFSNLERFLRAGERRGASARALRILFSGSLIRRKGVDLVAKAFAAILPSHPDLELGILGSGPLQPRLERTLSRLGRSARFLGFKDWDALPEYYACADILCVPSRYDGWGMVVPEGLAAGLPVIGTTQMGAAHELLTDGKNGWLVPPGDLDALIDALDKAASLTDQRLAEMRQAAVESIAHHHLANGAQVFENAALDTIASWSA